MKSFEEAIANEDFFRSHKSKSNQRDMFKRDLVAVHKMVSGSENDEHITYFKSVLEDLYKEPEEYIVYKSKAGKRK